MNTRWTTFGVLLAPFLETTLVDAAGRGQPPHLTPIDEVVMYGIDADTNELLRYTFDTNEYIRIGVVQDEDGREIDDVEGLAYIPQGPHKGFYGAPTKGSRQERLFRINPLDATARRCPLDIGFGDILGMIAVLDAATGNWLLVAVEKDENLIAIDPATSSQLPVAASWTAIMPRMSPKPMSTGQGRAVASSGLILKRRSWLSPLVGAP